MPEPYHGPQCPRCSVTLAETMLHTGTITCPNCGTAFEATLFHPPERRILAPELVGAGPEAGSSCANHARNAAVASCRRCGLFICSLCEMNVGTGTYCPSCFDRVRADGSLKEAAKRYRDYTTLGTTAVIAGIFFSFMFLGIPFGAVATYYGVKGLRQRREHGDSIVGPILVLVFAVLQILGGAAIIGLLVMGMMTS